MERTVYTWAQADDDPPTVKNAHLWIWWDDYTSVRETAAFSNGKIYAIKVRVVSVEGEG